VNNGIFWFVNAVGQNPTEQKIRAFAKFRPGWRMGSGKSFTNFVLDAACKITRKAIDSGFLKTDAFPGRNGDISVVLYDVDDSYEFSISDISIEFTHEKSIGEDEERSGLSLSDSIEIIPKLKEEKWNTFFTSTYVIMTGKKEDFVRLPSRNPAMEAVFRSSLGNVYWPQRDAFAPMPNGITPMSPILRYSFGRSDLPTYLKDLNWNSQKALLETTVT
jgi:hypothetical protein